MLPMTSVALCTIHDLAPRIERKEVSPVEVVRECVDRIDRLDGRLNSFVRYWPEEALAEAAALEREIAHGTYRGPLHGVPLAIKDNIAVAGWPTTNGSHLMADHVTDYDATVVRRLREAGAVILGKNNLHEWARWCELLRRTVRHDPQSLGPREGPRWLERWFDRSGERFPRVRRHRHQRKGLDPDSVGLLRGGGVEAHVRAGEPVRPAPSDEHAGRPRGSDRQRSHGPGDPAPGDRGARSRQPDVRGADPP